MNVNVISKTDNAVLERKEIQAEVSFDGPTPSREDIRKAICAKVGSNPDLTVLREVNNSFGKQSVNVVAHAYSDKEKMTRTEPEYVVKRDKVVEKPKPEEKPKEEPKAEEKPKEEAKKEEKPKPEEKKESPKEEAKPEDKPKEEKK
jgi:small subunit ribosomal protein S24e